MGKMKKKSLEKKTISKNEALCHDYKSEVKGGGGVLLSIIIKQRFNKYSISAMVKISST